MNFIDGTEAGAEGLIALARRALDLRAGAAPGRFPGRRVAAVFLNPSLRTRASLEAAADLLGGHAIVVQPGRDAWALELREGAVMDGGAAEHVREAAAVLAGYADVLAVRAFAGLVDAEADRADPVIAAFARHSRVPVVNLESARWHPLQGLADAATWLAHLGPDLRGVPLTLTWAPHPRALPAAVPQQVLLTAATLGMRVTVAHPEGFDLDPEVVARASALAPVRVVHDPDEGVRGARVVVAKSWAGWSGYGRREEEARRRAELGRWTVTAERLARSDDAGFMHCLPVRRNVVVTDEVLDGPRSWVVETAHLRMHTAAALLERLWSGAPEPARNP